MRQWIPLSPAKEVETVKGFGLAEFILDQGEERDLQYYVCIMEGVHQGQYWIIKNQEVRAVKNWTLDRGRADELRTR